MAFAERLGFAYDNWPFLIDCRSLCSQRSEEALGGGRSANRTRHADVEETGGTALHYACFNGLKNLVKDLISKYMVRVDAMDKKGFTPLMTACEEGHLSIVKLLVPENCFVNSSKIQRHRRKTSVKPLHVASFYGHCAIVEYLLDTGAANANEKTNGHLSTVQYLCSNQCDVNVENQNKWAALHFASSKGRSAIVEYLVGNSAVDVNGQTNDGSTALMLACEKGHLSTVRILCSYGCDVNVKDQIGRTAFHIASFNGHSDVVKYIVNNCSVNVNEKTNNGSTALRLACQKDNLSTVQFLFSNQCDATAKSQLGWTALHDASCNGHSSIVEYLVNNCALDVDERTNDGWTALMLACRGGHISSVQFLCSVPCDVNVKNQKGWTALHVASFNGRTDIVKYLVGKCAVNNVDEQAIDGSTALILACEKGHLSTVKLLCSNRCDVNVKEKIGWTALHVASFNGHSAIVAYLISSCAASVSEQANNGSTAFMLACQEGHLSTVKFLLSNYCDVSVKNQDEWTALHFASFNGHSSVVEYLVDNCAVDVNEQAKTGSTPLMLACVRGHIFTVQFLFSIQCDVNVKNQMGWTALHEASFNGHFHIVEYLVRNCALGVNQQTNNGSTALMLACRKGHLPIVQFFCSTRCDVNVKNQNKWTALHFASFNGHCDIVEFLVDNLSVNVNKQANNGWTALMLACQEGHLSIVQFLFSNQCDVNVKIKNGWTPLHVTASNGNDAILDYLVTSCAVDIDEQANNGMTALMLACKKGHLASVKFLCSNRCDVNAKNQNGWTPLHAASSNGHSAVVKFLVDNFAATLNKRTNDGCTALMLACRKGHLSTVQFLCSFQCGINVKNKNGRTPLHFASYNGHSAIVEFLICRCAVEALINGQDNDGSTALMLACRKGHLSTVQCLCSNQCDVNVKNQRQWTLLHVASSNGHSSIVEYLVDNCCVNVNEQTIVGSTALILACSRGHLSTVRFLCSNQCDLNVKNQKGWTALHAAVFNDHSVIVKCLVNNFAVDVNEPDYSGRTPFHLACANGRNDSALFLLNETKSFVKPDSKCFLMALENCCMSVAQQLARLGCFDKTSAIQSVLSVQHFRESADILQLISTLLDHGASATSQNAHGDLPYQNASGQCRYLLKRAWLESQYANLATLGTSSPSQIKVCVFGDEMAGKTSLIESLQLSFLGAVAKSIIRQGVPSRTAGIKFHKANISFAGDLVFCDFGGQKNFHKTHSLFFSSETVLVYVTDLSRSWNDIRSSGLYWLSFAKCSLFRSKKNHKVSLMLVGSRGDKVGPESLTSLLTFLKAKFSEWFDICDKEFVLDCRSPTSRTMNAIRAHLHQLKQQCIERATKVPNIIKKVESNLLPRLSDLLSSSSHHPLQVLVKDDKLLPVKLLSFIRQLLRDDQIYTKETIGILDDFELTERKILRTTSHSIASGLLLAMIEKTIFSGLSKAVQMQILKFLHMYSSVIFFEEEDLVVVNPNWLCHNVIGPLMSPEEFPTHLTSTDGIFSLDDIRIALHQFNKRQRKPWIDVNEAIRILCRLEICFPLPNSPQCYQFPALAQEKRPAEAWIKNADMRVYIGRRLECQSDTDIIIPGTMPFFQAHVAASRKPSSLCPIIWQGGVKAFETFDNLHFEVLVELAVNDRAIDIIVRGPEHSEAECYKRLETTKQMVEKMLDKRSPGTRLSELVLSRKVMEILVETRHAYSFTDIEDAKDCGLCPQIGSSPTSNDFISDLVVVPEKHINVVLPCHAKRSLLRGLVSTLIAPEKFARSLGMRTAKLSFPSTAQSVFVEWSRQMDATLPKLIAALEETKHTSIIKMFMEENLFPIEITNGCEAQADTETTMASDDEYSLSDSDCELGDACFRTPEEPEGEVAAVTSRHVEDENTNLAKDPVVKDYHIEAFKYELFDDSDDVISFGSKLLGWSRERVKNYLSDRPDRRNDQKMSLILYRWKRKLERPTIKALLLVLKGFDKEGIAIQLLKKCKKP
ncbi:uncharacterized protein [Oscarella lobularis]|uniref:uncharacterized protein isoform X3 n=1 Tax=Oscarella lobularis TaxID=121494 RepID=UPI0033136203